jgi:hypothetical protein
VKVRKLALSTPSGKKVLTACIPELEPANKKKASSNIKGSTSSPMGNEYCLFFMVFLFVKEVSPNSALFLLELYLHRVVKHLYSLCYNNFHDTDDIG